MFVGGYIAITAKQETNRKEILTNRQVSFDIEEKIDLFLVNQKRNYVSIQELKKICE